MREKLYIGFKRTYGIMMTISFFAGGIPLIPFIIALIVGGEWAEAVCIFLYKQYYPWVIIIGSLAIVVGLIAMYIGKLEGLSVKSVAADDKKTGKNN